MILKHLIALTFFKSHSGHHERVRTACWRLQLPCRKGLMQRCRGVSQSDRLRRRGNSLEIGPSPSTCLKVKRNPHAMRTLGCRSLHCRSSFPGLTAVQCVVPRVERDYAHSGHRALNARIYGFHEHGLEACRARAIGYLLQADRRGPSARDGRPSCAPSCPETLLGRAGSERRADLHSRAIRTPANIEGRLVLRSAQRFRVFKIFRAESRFADLRVWTPEVEKRRSFSRRRRISDSAG